MPDPVIDSAAHIFDSRLATLEHLLQAGAAHLREDEASLLARRLAPDMLPLGTQVAFACNQPRNFALWVEGAPSDDLNPVVETMATALGHVQATRALLAGLRQAGAGMPVRKHLVLGEGLHADLTGEEYVADFLLPNFYFHVVTAYAILRGAGVPLGKRDYMLHLLPKVTLGAT
jgi:hypothetical protein